jgi:hypothetical protein
MVLSVFGLTSLVAFANPPDDPSGTATWDFTGLSSNGSGTGWRWDHGTLPLTLSGINHSTTADIALKVPYGTTIVLVGTNSIISTYDNDDDTCGIFS